MIRCNNCGTDNLDGSEYCDECGTKLDLSPPFRVSGRNAPPAYQPPSGATRPPVRNGDSAAPGQRARSDQGDQISQSSDGVPSPPSFTNSTSVPKPARPLNDQRQALGAAGQPPASLPAEPPRPGQTLVLASRGRTDALRPDQAEGQQTENKMSCKLVIERGGRVGKEFSVTGAETHIGRWDADSGIFPDVDLDQDDPEAKVSRRHARIMNQNGQFFIEDLGSTNGTFVNRGRRLLPGHRHPLQSGDEIIVGKTFLKFHILR
jgi:hypothetical protein